MRSERLRIEPGPKYVDAAAEAVCLPAFLDVPHIVTTTGFVSKYTDPKRPRDFFEESWPEAMVE
jgi:hypothetical protein